MSIGISSGSVSVSEGEGQALVCVALIDTGPQPTLPDIVTFQLTTLDISTGQIINHTQLYYYYYYYSAPFLLVNLHAAVFYTIHALQQLAIIIHCIFNPGVLTFTGMFGMRHFLDSNVFVFLIE